MRTYRYQDKDQYDASYHRALKRQLDGHLSGFGTETAIKHFMAGYDAGFEAGRAATMKVVLDK